jgi:hypothetical protein
MRQRLALSLLLVPILAACGGATPSSTEPGGGATPAPEATQSGGGDSEPTPGTALSACDIVAPEDIEAAVDLDAGTVGEGELKEAGTVLDPAATECRYQGDWGGLVVSLTPADGVNVFDALVSSFGDEAETLEIGDGALWFADDDRGYFLQGPVMVRLQFTHLTERPASGTFREATIAIGTAALEKL